jgi:SAM-dependent methyltransferase
VVAQRRGKGDEERPARAEGARGRANAPKFRPNTPKGTTFRKPALELFTTTLWEYPSQHYLPADASRAAGAGVQGDPNYVGATPSWVVWQLLRRYTAEGERVLDPMCGSGTTLDVCEDLGRYGKGFDLAPSRPDIERADARRLPLPDECCDFAFVDPPYSTHVKYSGDPACIGMLDAGGPDRGAAYYDAMRDVIAEIHRVLRPGRYMGLYVSDSWRKQERAPKRQSAKGAGPAAPGEFMPIGFELFSLLRERFDAADIVVVVRHNAKLKRGAWHEAAAREGFLLRGFNYLFIMRKPEAARRAGRPARDRG